MDAPQLSRAARPCDLAGSGYRGAVRAFLWGSLLCLGLLANSARAQSTLPPFSMSMDVPAGCSSTEAFVVRLESLDAALVGAHLVVTVEPSWSGLMRGVLRVEREGAVPVERMIEDDRCEDVVDALAITAALVLRMPPEPLPPPEEVDVPDVTVALPVQPPANDDPAAEARPLPLRGLLSVAFRLGLGVVPGVSVAPDLGAALEVDRLVIGLHLLYWPEAGAPSDLGVAVSQGVALQALASTIEVGARLGEDLGIVPSVVVELSGVVARGLGVEAPRTEWAFACDVGAALVAYLDVAGLRFFVRGDLLFALAQPAYVVGARPAYETPAVRGTGSVGMAVLFGP